MRQRNLSGSIVLIIIFLLMGCSVIQAQEIDSTTQNSDKLGLAADILTHATDKLGRSRDTLTGNVKITQDSLFLFCNKAYVLDDYYVEAYGDVVIIQGDSIHLFADSMIFDDRSDLANLFGEVIIKNGEKRLDSREVEYDILNKRAYYKDGATLTNKGSQLISERGTYEVSKDKAFFRDKVTIIDSAFVLKSDSLNYDLLEEVIYIIAPSRITTDSTAIYCEGGWYESKTRKGVFYNNVEILTDGKRINSDKVLYYGDESKYYLTGYPIVRDTESIARADTIVYYEEVSKVELIGRAFYKDADRDLRSDRIDYDLNEESFQTYNNSVIVDNDGRVVTAGRFSREEDGTDIAEYNVIIKDTSELFDLYGEKLLINNAGKDIKTYGINSQPLLIKALDTDSLFLLSDTLVMIDQDTNKIYHGDQNIKFNLSEHFGVSDYLDFNSEDSVFVFSGKPYIWSDSIQLTGDTIFISMSNNAMDYMKVKGNAFMIIKGEQGSFNQVKGEEIINYFSGKNLNKTTVSGNAEMVYFMYEEGKLEGVNHALSGGLTFYFKSDDLDHIDFFDKPNSTFTKGEVSDVESYNLQGFNWDESNKPEKIQFVVK